MKITLQEPFSVGDLAPDVTYPHVYITTFYVNGPARMASIGYEVGELRDVSPGNPMGTWLKATEVPGSNLELRGDQLYPFFGAQVTAGENVDPYLWDQVEMLLYQLIQKSNSRLVGDIT